MGPPGWFLGNLFTSSFVIFNKSENYGLVFLFDYLGALKSIEQEEERCDEWGT